METGLYFDSHAHYDDARFEEQFPGGAEGALKKAFEEGVCGIVTTGTNPVTSRAAVKIADSHDGIYAAVGIHPSDGRFIEENERDGALGEIEAMLSLPKVVALGEIGLDYHYDGTDREMQKYFFERQLDMAVKHDVPVVIHDRDAHGDVFDIISRHKNARGVMHCFSGSAESGRQLAKKGWYLSFGGSVTFKNARQAKEAATAVPDDRLLIETDCPYLAPTPHRGEINYSGYLRYVVSTLAEIRGTSAERIAEITRENALMVFGL